MVAALWGDSDSDAGYKESKTRCFLADDEKVSFFEARTFLIKTLTVLKEVVDLQEGIIKDQNDLIEDNTECLKELNNGQFVALIKPQFEAGRADIGKNGIVKSPAAHERVLKNFCSLLASLHLSLSALIASPVRGGDGNIEYLAAFSHVPADFTPDFRAIVRAAFAAKS